MGERTGARKKGCNATRTLKSRIRATAPIKTISSQRRIVNHVRAENSSRGTPTRHKCWICSDSLHWPDQCPKFAVLSIDDRYRAVKENNVCFSCLKKAGKDHKASNCSRRQQCVKFDNRLRCTSFHHQLLHKTKPFQIGETKQAIHLVVQHSPLGWVIFGARPGERLDATHILHVKYAAAVDLTSFWTTEAMGVNVKSCVCSADKVSQAERDEGKIIEDSCVKVGEQWMIPYPCKRDPKQLPDNKQLAVKRLKSMKRWSSMKS